jgi:hypothetical protein
MIMEENMGKYPLKRSLIVGIIFLFLSTTYIPVLASEGKPDLIVASMSFSPYGDSETEIVAAATIKNIGDTKATGTLYLEYTFSRLIFGTITNTDIVCMFGGLEPGEEAYWPLIYESELPKFGFFEFKCTVNPGGGAIEESNYDNNDLAQKYVAFLGQWKEIG